jgi:hypothetical protein
VMLSVCFPFLGYWQDSTEECVIDIFPSDRQEIKIDLYLLLVIYNGSNGIQNCSISSQTSSSNLTLSPHPT